MRMRNKNENVKKFGINNVFKSEMCEGNVSENNVVEINNEINK